MNQKLDEIKRMAEEEIYEWKEITVYRQGNPYKCMKKVLRDDLKRKFPFEYSAWINMNGRCHNPKHISHPVYKRKNITVCSQWRKSFKDFLEYVGPRPSQKHSLDRIDNDGNYEPGNVRWATRAQQGKNRTYNVFLEYKGKKMALFEWAKELGLTRNCLKYRVKNWKDMDKVFSPVKQVRNGRQR